MSSTITTPLMSLIVPVNLVDGAPDWGQRLMDAFTAIDSHDHSTGKGKQVTPAGLNINADLAFGSKNATLVRSVRLVSQGAPLSTGPDIDCVYVSAGELWYNDASARQVQLTQSGAVKSAPQSLSFKSVTTSYTILAADPYQLFWLHSETAATGIALPSSAGVAIGRTYYFADVGQNSAANTATFSPNGTDTINGVNAAATVNANGALTTLTTDGAGHWTMTTQPVQPLGTAAARGVAIATGTVTPTAAQLAKGVLEFTGTLTGNVVIVFPNAQGYFLCDFSAVVMGGFTLAVRSGSTTSATMAAANVGSTQTLAQVSQVLTYGGNTIRIHA